MYIIIKQYIPSEVRRNDGWFSKNLEIFQGFLLNHEGTHSPSFSRPSTRGYKAETEDPFSDMSVSGLMYFNLQYAQREARRFEKEVNAALGTDFILEVISIEDLKELYYENQRHFEKVRQEEAAARLSEIANRHSARS